MKGTSHNITKSVVNILIEILHVNRGKIVMKQKKKQDFSFESHGLIPWVDLGCLADAKNQLFRNMVMLQIRLKGMKHRITC